MAKKEQILELLNAYKSEVDNFNDAVFTDKFDVLAQDIVKLFAIPDVVKATRTCAKCNSTDMMMFNSNLDICNDCGCTQIGA